MKPAGFGVVVLVLSVFCVSIAQAAISVTYTVQTDVNRTPISKYVYGNNWGSGTDYTIRRSGGNRLTGYNWENNFSNAGADWYHSNDRYLVGGLPPDQQLIPGKAITVFHNEALSQGQASVVTLQMAGYVSADDYGEVNVAQTAPSSRWRKVVFAKGSPFCNPPGSPNTVDANVYMDEFVNFLVYTYGYAGTTNGVKFYDLDNEPDIWSDGAGGGTHPRIHPSDPCCLEYKNLSKALSTAVKNVDPNAQIMGPVSYGFAGFMTFQGASDWGTQGAGYDWFLSYYLHKMGIDSNTAGKRLLDGLDVHWYPEAKDTPNFADGNRITNDIRTRAMFTARMQAPRSLWDYDYHENSWIEQWYGSWLPILPPLKSSISKYYPDTNLAITEYAYGGETHWSGGIATSDVLGIFGKYGVQVATYWGDGNYVDDAIKMYTNYNGALSKFGDMNVPAGMSNKTDSSIYASVPSQGDLDLHMIVINKNQDNSINGTFSITSSTNYIYGRVWAFDGNDVNITERTDINNITSNSFTYSFPRVSVSHIRLVSQCPAGDIENDVIDGSGYDCDVDMYDLGSFCDQWLNPSLYCPGSNCGDLNGDGQINFNDFVKLQPDWRL